MRFGRKKTLIDRAQDYVEQVAETVTETVIPQIESALEQTRDKAGPALADAREKAKPLIAEGRAKAHEGRVLAAEKASVGAALAAEKAAVGRELAAAKVAEIKGEEPEPKGGKLKKILIFGGLLAIAGVVFKKFGAKKESANWQSSYVPAPPPPAPATPSSGTTTTAAAAPVDVTPTGGDPLTDPLPGASDDAGGGAPGEALSDAADAPHSTTTPDDPAEVISVDDVPKS